MINCEQVEYTHHTYISIVLWDTAKKKTAAENLAQIGRLSFLLVSPVVSIEIEIFYLNNFN